MYKTKNNSGLDKKSRIILQSRNSNRGYVFATKLNLHPDDLDSMSKRLQKDLQQGILIYPSDALKLIDTYDITTSTITTDTQYQVQE